MKGTEKAATEKPRKPYSKPRVISHGHIKDIVQGGGGTKNDAGSPSKSSCWIAEAIYGEFDPRTLLLRAWLTRGYDEGRAWWPLVSLYRVCGRTVAGLIRTGRLSRKPFVPVFDRLFIKANDETVRMLRRR